MKINGKLLQPPSPVSISFPRDDGDIKFICGAVLDYKEFDKLCPPPKAPLTTNIATGEQSVQNDSRRFRAANEAWHGRRIDFMIIKSLMSSEGLEWETVKIDDPETWALYEAELKAFLTEAEYNKLINTVIEANSPTGKRRQEAMDVFSRTAGGVQQETQDSRREEPTNIASTEPANASV